jgi:hypothetical protein
MGFWLCDMVLFRHKDLLCGDYKYKIRYPSNMTSSMNTIVLNRTVSIFPNTFIRFSLLNIKIININIEDSIDESKVNGNQNNTQKKP